MLTSLILQGLLLLTGTRLRLYGAPTHLPDFNHMQDDSCEGHCPSLVTTAVLTHTTESVLLNKEHVTSSVLNVGAGGGGGGGGTGPHGGPEGLDLAMQTENGDSLHGRFRPSEAGGEAQSQRREGKQIDSTEEEEDEKRRNKKKLIDDESFSPVGGRDQMDAERRTKLSFSDSDQYLWTQKLSSSSPIPSLMFVTPQTSTPLTVWKRDGATVSSPSDPILPEIGPSMMTREDDLESLWTEAVRPAGVDIVDDATDATMSSEALPLIFEPFEDVTAKGQAAEAAAIARVPVGAQSPVTTATRRLGQLVTVEDDSDSPSQGPSALLPDWTSPWQTSGSELLEPIGSLGPLASQRRVQTEPEERWPGKAAARTSNFEENVPSAGPSLSSLQHAMTTVTLATHQLLHKSRLGLEEMDSDEEPDEEEDDENSEESVEEESEEDLTETPKASSTQPPYSLIPPPPVWVQRNQGLMRSWLELIREKAGYVSGMLAPVGIGITGALLIVGALYSIRMIHRKRRNSFKRQRRKARQPEQPREPGTSCQDQTMLLADSSEDEF